MLPIAGTLYVSGGLFTVDEFLYLISVHELATSGSLIVSNGFEKFGSNDLLLWFMIDGPNGLAPQYPPGLALLGAPLYVAFGVHGLILLNAMAAVGVILLTWWFARRLFQDTSVATVALLLLVLNSFFLEYAWGVWPHMSATFFVLLAFAFALVAMERDETTSVLIYAILSAVAVTAGMFLRTDSILVLAVIGLCVLLLAERPLITILGGVLGLLPGVIALSIINNFKFGTYNILSYGRSGSGGGDDITSHFGSAIVLALVVGALLVAKRVEWTRPKAFAGLAIAVVILSAALFLPATGEALRSIGHGYHALFADSRVISDPRSGVIRQPDGTLIFWGVAKKALFQSLPWLGAIAALLVGGWAAKHRKGVFILLIFVGVWSLPFAALAWHGGYSSSMRYFLPIVPPLCLLVANVIVDLAKKVQLSSGVWGLGLLISIVGGIWVFVQGTYPAAWQQQVLTLYGFAFVFVTVLLASVRGAHQYVASLFAVVALCVSFGLSAAGNFAMDALYAQLIRDRSDAFSSVAGSLTGNVLFYGPPHIFASGVSNPDAVFAMNDNTTREVDFDLLKSAKESGYQLFILERVAEDFVSTAELNLEQAAEFPGLPIVTDR